VAEGDLDPRLLYVNGRKKYSRPSGMLWSENSGTLVEDPASITTPKKKIYVPIGFEVGTDPESIEDESLIDQFLFLTDDNRQPIDIKTERIEKRERMINGRMRSYHIADKTTVSVNWDMIPSRSHENFPNFDRSFWVFLAYDRKGIFKGTPEPYDHLRQYNQLIEMFISDFSYSVEKRGTKFDYWNVSVTLEEV